MKGTACMPDEGVLAAPVFAVGELGKTCELPAGTKVELVRFNSVKVCPGAVTVLAANPELDYRSDLGVWYVTASALRFEEQG